jgi:mannose-1-phosphate guanylyltransferase
LSQKILEKKNTEYIDIIESTPRNTAAIAFAALQWCRWYFDCNPSDHIIDDIEAYETAIQEAVEKASQGFIVWNCCHKPETGYGYIERKGDDVF